jgi:hypothetical protein
LAAWGIEHFQFQVWWVSGNLRLAAIQTRSPNVQVSAMQVNPVICGFLVEENEMKTL